MHWSKSRGPEGAAARHRRLWRRGRERRHHRRRHRRDAHDTRMNDFAELLDRLAYEPGRNNKLRLIADYLRTTPDPERGYALAALTGALSFQHAKAGMIRALIAERTDPVLFELSYDYVGDLSETVALMWPRRSGAEAERRAGAVRGDRDARHARQDATADAARALARRARRDRPLGAAEARHRRAAHRRLGAAGEDRGRLARRQGAERDRDSLAGACAALHRTVRLAGRPRREARDARSGAVPAGDAGACDRGDRFRRARPEGLHRRMEMGRHPRAGRRGRQRRGQDRAALFAHRRGHLEKLSRSHRSAAAAGLDRRRAADRARRPGAVVQRAAAAAQPQSRDAEDARGVSRAPARLRSAGRRRRGSARTAVRRTPRAARRLSWQSSTIRGSICRRRSRSTPGRR